jgi:hypothetical protein
MYFFIVGVVQLLNKMDGKPFNLNDENLFEVLNNICLYWRFKSKTVHFKQKIKNRDG